jgi:hypothetical protein
MLVRTMIKLFGSVRCGYPGCEATYDTMMNAVPSSTAEGMVFHCLKPQNSPKGWVTSNFYFRCPEHAHSGER